LTYIEENLPDQFLLKSFQSFCDLHEEEAGTEIFLTTEIDPAFYKVAIAPQYDGLQRRLVDHMVEDLEDWLDKKDLPCIAFSYTGQFMKQLYSIMNGTVDSGDTALKFVLNDELVNIPRNILINYTSERYNIRQQKIPGELLFFESVDKLRWIELSGGLGEEQHFLLVTRIGETLLKQYRLTNEEVDWIEDRAKESLVFLRRRIVFGDPATERVQLFIIQSLKDWLAFATHNHQIPIISNISMRVWANTEWESRWLEPIRKHCINTILFDLPPHSQLDTLFSDSCDTVRIQKAKLAYNGYNYGALVLQGIVKQGLGETPLFFMPGSEITCNVIASYMMNEMRHGLVQEDRQFLHDNSTVVQTMLSRLFREERTFDFNLI